MTGSLTGLSLKTKSPGTSTSWKSGEYRVAVKYTCPKKDIGSQIRIKVNDHELTAVVDQPFDPDLFPNRDRAPRSGELEKPWAILELGKVKIDRGVKKLVLSADRMPGTQVMEVRGVILERVSSTRKSDPLEQERISRDDH